MGDLLNSNFQLLFHEKFLLRKLTFDRQNFKFVFHPLALTYQISEERMALKKLVLGPLHPYDQSILGCLDIYCPLLFICESKAPLTVGSYIQSFFPIKVCLQQNLKTRIKV